MSHAFAICSLLKIHKRKKKKQNKMITNVYAEDEVKSVRHQRQRQPQHHGFT